MISRNIVFFLSCFVIIAGGFISSYFLFDFSDSPNGLIALEVIEKNRANAPTMNLDFPAHQKNEFKSCLGCHGISDKVASKRDQILNPQFKKMGFSSIPVIPHEHNENLNCLSCHAN